MFDLKNYKPGAKSLVVPLAKLNQSASQPDDLELKAFRDAEQVIRELGQDTATQSPTPSAPLATTSAASQEPTSTVASTAQA